MFRKKDLKSYIHELDEIIEQQKPHFSHVKFSKKDLEAIRSNNERKHKIINQIKKLV